MHKDHTKGPKKIVTPRIERGTFSGLDSNCKGDIITTILRDLELNSVLSTTINTL